MDQLLQQVTRAQRRLATERFCRRLVVWLFVAFAVAAVAIALPKLVAIAGLPAFWAQGWLIAAPIVALLAAGLDTYARRQGALEAAIEIDKRYDLRERVASSLSLSEEDRTSQVGKALLEDAVRKVDRVDIGEKFRVRLGRHAWLPLVPAVLAFCLMMFAPNQEAVSKPDQPKPLEVTKADIKKSAEELRKKIAARRKEAEKKNLKDADGLLKQVEAGVKEISDKATSDPKKALVKLNDLAKELEKKRQQLGGKQALEDQLKQMKNLGKGPAEKAANAIKQGDMQKALDEIGKMQKALADGKMSKNDQKKLAEQLGKMKQQLQQAAEAHKQAMEDLKKQIADAQRKGDNDQAGKLQQKLDKMQQAKPQMDKLQQLAQKMGQAQQAMKNGDPKQAADAMQQMAQQMQQMQQEQQQMDMLADAMEMLQDAKGGMNGQKPGEMMPGGDMMGMMPGMGQGKGDQRGPGMGEGKGGGPRPDEKNPTAMRDTKVKQNAGRGDSVFSGLVDGPNRKGNVTQGLKEELASQAAAEADPLTGERLPRSRREHAQEFFNKLREEL